MTSVIYRGGSFDLPSGPTVHRIGFGAMRFAGPGVFGPPIGRQRALDVSRRAVELGADHIDTSDFHGPCVVELSDEDSRQLDELVAEGKTLEPTR
jgi:aryl-alcohol dehydrogenase-like predicted oxidoreductase